MWWKVYFWFTVVLVASSIIYGYGQYPMWTLSDWVDIASTITAMIGLYAYVFHKKLFTGVFWKWYFLLDVAITAFLLLYFFSILKEFIPLPSFLQSRSIRTGQELLLSIFISLPLYYALFQLGDFAKPQKKKKK